MTPALAAWLLLPAVAGLQRYAVSYGYGGRQRQAYRVEAWRLALLLYAVEAAIAAWWVL